MELEAEQELDAKVAEILGCHPKFGWVDGFSSEERYTGMMFCTCRMQDHEQPTDHTIGGPLLAMYSHNPAACAEVKKWLCDRGITTNMWLREKEVWVKGYNGDDGPCYQRLGQWIKGPTEELAICRLVLALKEAGVV